MFFITAVIVVIIIILILIVTTTRIVMFMWSFGAQAQASCQGSVGAPEAALRNPVALEAAAAGLGPPQDLRLAVSMNWVGGVV